MDRDTLYREWKDALLSGQFKQIDGVLSADNQFCCLGVVCELMYQHGELNKVNKELIGDIKEFAVQAIYEYEEYNLPPKAQELLGMNGDGEFLFDDLSEDLKEKVSEYVDIGRRMGCTSSLVTLNDRGAPFALIAEVIKEIETKKAWQQ